MESRVNPHANYHTTEQITPMPDPGDSPIAISLDDVRRAGPRADLAHASRIRRTVAQRRRVHRPPKEAPAVVARPAVEVQPALDFSFAPLPAAEGLSNPYLIPDLYTTTANNCHPPGFVEQETESVEMDEHGRIIPDESHGDDEEMMLKVESPCAESSLALIEGHRRAGESLMPLTARRPRGRPRKHPILCESANKIAKGRSKTGCITCRKRKKKCDETKPRCMNCEKNAVVCEGYPERMVWKSGREKAEGLPTWARQMPEAVNVSTGQFSMAAILPNIQLQPVIHGIETAGDRIFFEHYVFRLSSVLTVEGPQKNAFKDMLLPMAVKHLGLMHSILSLSSSNMDYQSDYGKAILAKHTDVDQQMLEERAQFHQDEAVKEFFLDIERQQTGGVENAVLPAIYGQMLCFVVKSLTEGQTTGAHRVHLHAYQKLIRETPPEDTPFMDFVNEYFQFHIALDGLVGNPHDPPSDSDDDASLATPLTLPSATLPHQQAPSCLFGIDAPLFTLMAHITHLRTRIRRNLARRAVPAVDYHSLHRATVIDAAIRGWQPPAPLHDVRHVAALLYRQMLWVYLWRSIYPPSASAWAPDSRIADAVDGALALLRLVPPMDPCQAMLLAPTFVVGCAAFEPAQRAPVRESVRVIKEYTGLKNADRALEVLEAVWRYMDARDERSWDWQGIAGEMEMEFLAT